MHLHSSVADCTLFEILDVYSLCVRVKQSNSSPCVRVKQSNSSPCVRVKQSNSSQCVRVKQSNSSPRVRVKESNSSPRVRVKESNSSPCVRVKQPNSSPCVRVKQPNSSPLVLRSPLFLHIAEMCHTRLLPRANQLMSSGFYCPLHLLAVRVVRNSVLSIFVAFCDFARTTR